jgi:hypothetical protein
MAKQTVTFFSNFTQHQLVRQPRNDKPVPTGVGWINDTPGVRYQFMPAIDDSGKLVGRLDVRVGQDVMQDTSGWLAADQDQDIKRDAPDALRAHREYGGDFWLMPVPATSVRSRIRQASVALSEEDLVALLAEERASTNPRADLLSEAEDALSLVREAVETLRASQEAQEAEQAAPKAKAKPKAPAAA